MNTAPTNVDPAPVPYDRAEYTSYGIECRACELYGAPIGTGGAAAHFVGVHDDIHHHGEPTAAVCRV